MLAGIVQLHFQVWATFILVLVKTMQFTVGKL